MEVTTREPVQSVPGMPTKYWHTLDDGRVQCDVCPRACRLREGQRGLCFVRAREGGEIVSTTWGRSSGFCVDPIEKKPLNHFVPGSHTSVAICRHRPPFSAEGMIKCCNS